MTFQPPTRDALEQIAERMCAEDLAELTACGWASPIEALVASVDASRESHVACWDGLPQAVCGIADFTPDNSLGVPWMLSTGPRGRAAREFIMHSRDFVAAWQPMYSSLFNFVDARHLRAQRWLLALGFLPFKVHDCNGLPFIEFGLMRNV